ncbi:MAG: hypothetical protein HYX21_03385 [Candidatus Yanofskybacteria bacterium]|nr:hypothetical protein [Candidatus Yanofskybacteria bacterium]
MKLLVVFLLFFFTALFLFGVERVEYLDASVMTPPRKTFETVLRATGGNAGLNAAIGGLIMGIPGAIVGAAITETGPFIQEKRLKTCQVAVLLDDTQLSLELDSDFRNREKCGTLEEGDKVTIIKGSSFLGAPRYELAR